jgi:methyl-accepting chemotaxis protein
MYDREDTLGVELDTWDMNNAITEMDELTQRNAALVEQSAAAAQSMQEQPHDLLREVDAFCLGDGGPPLLPRQ